MIDQGTGYMTTFTGLQFKHGEPRTRDICVEDIAHHLSLICHWGGAARTFFSVAQHSVIVSQVCPPELARWGLMHDAAEAYCGDMIRPLKVRLPEYKLVETNVMGAIAEKFGLGWPEPSALKYWDNRVLAVEARDFMHSNEALHDGRGNLIRFEDLPEKPLKAIKPRAAERLFLKRFLQLWPNWRHAVSVTQPSTQPQDSETR